MVLEKLFAGIDAENKKINDLLRAINPEYMLHRSFDFLSRGLDFSSRDDIQSIFSLNRTTKFVKFDDKYAKLIYSPEFKPLVDYLKERGYRIETALKYDRKSKLETDQISSLIRVPIARSLLDLGVLEKLGIDDPETIGFSNERYSCFAYLWYKEKNNVTSVLIDAIRNNPPPSQSNYYFGNLKGRSVDYSESDLMDRVRLIVDKRNKILSVPIRRPLKSKKERVKGRRALEKILSRTFKRLIS